MKNFSKLFDSKSFSGPFSAGLGIAAAVAAWHVGDLVFSGIKSLGSKKKAKKAKVTTGKKKKAA